MAAETRRYKIKKICCFPEKLNTVTEKIGITQHLIDFSHLYKQQWPQAMLRRTPLGSYVHGVG